MDTLDLIRRLHHHRQWVNHNILETVGELTDEQLRRSFAIGQGSVWKTLTHLYAAEYVWLATLEGDEQPVVPGDDPNKLPGNQERDNAIATLPELCSLWLQLDERWNAYLQDLTADDLQRDVVKVSSQSRQRLVTACSDVLLHLCTHAQYTVAQLINMLRQLGVKDFPRTMLITMARDRS